MPTPPDFIQNWNQEDDLLNFFLAGDGGGNTGLTPPMPSFTPEGAQMQGYQGPIDDSMPPPIPQPFRSNPSRPIPKPKPESFNDAVAAAGKTQRNQRTRKKTEKGMNQNEEWAF